MTPVPAPAPSDDEVADAEIVDEPATSSSGVTDDPTSESRHDAVTSGHARSRARARERRLRSRAEPSTEDLRSASEDEHAASSRSGCRPTSRTTASACCASRPRSSSARTKRWSSSCCPCSTTSSSRSPSARRRRARRCARASSSCTRELVGVLEKAGLERIDTDGKPFDPNVHEAVLHDDGDGEPAVVETHAHGLPLEGTRAAAGDGARSRRGRPSRWRRSGSGSRRTTTRCSASRRDAIRQGHHAAPTASSRSSTTPTRTRVTRTPRSASRRCRPRTTCSATPRSARSTTRSARWSPQGVGPGRVRRAFGPGLRCGGQNFHFDDVGGLGDLFGNLFGGGARRSRVVAAAWSRRGPPARCAARTSRPSCTSTSSTPCTASPRRCTSRPRRCARCAAAPAPSPARPRDVPHVRRLGAVAVDQGPFSFSQVCPTCGGRGQIVKDKCKKCKGRGVEVRPREVKVRIPAGVTGGAADQGGGTGRAGRNGGPPGDLFVIVHVAHAPGVRAVAARRTSPSRCR